MSIKERIINIVDRSPNSGNTAASVTKKLNKQLAREGLLAPQYHSVRARLSELVKAGLIFRNDRFTPARYF